jgi:excisionase family DNA binding protein
MKRRTLITVETDRIILMSGRAARPVRWCAACAGEARMVTVDEAAALIGVSSRTIYQQVEADELHFTETPEGRLYICLNSLPRKL